MEKFFEKMFEEFFKDSDFNHDYSYTKTVKYKNGEKVYETEKEVKDGKVISENSSAKLADTEENNTTKKTCECNKNTCKCKNEKPFLGYHYAEAVKCLNNLKEERESSTADKHTAQEWMEMYLSEKYLHFDTEREYHYLQFLREQDKNELKMKIDELQNSVDHLTIDYNKLKMENETMDAEYKELHKKYSELKNKFNKLNEIFGN